MTSARTLLDDVESLLAEGDWALRRTSDTTLVAPLRAIPLEMVELAATGESSLTLSLAIADTREWSPPSVSALSVVAARVRDAVPTVRVVLDDGPARFQVSFVVMPSANELTRALESLDAAAYFHLREARALENASLACFFLAHHQPKRRDQ